MRELKDRVAVGTGGASGIGLALGGRFAREGMKVVLADIEALRLDAAVAELRQAGHEVAGILTDVADADSVEALARETLRLHGRVHVLCNNAGVVTHGVRPIWQATVR